MKSLSTKFYKHGNLISQFSIIRHTETHFIQYAKAWYDHNGELYALEPFADQSDRPHYYNRMMGAELDEYMGEWSVGITPLDDDDIDDYWK